MSVQPDGAPDASSPLPGPAMAGAVLGVVVDAPAGVLRVRFGNAEPLTVRAVVGLDTGALAPGRTVIAVRVAGEAAPVVLGVLGDGLDSLEAQVDFESSNTSAPETPTLPAEQMEASLPLDGAIRVQADGQRVDVEAERELVLRCGQASITLRADGKVVIHGTHILSHSTGPHRLKGGSLSIN